MSCFLAHHLVCVCMSVDDEMMVEERDSVEFERLSHPVVCVERVGR